LGSKVKESLPFAQFTGLKVELERSEPQKRWVVGRGRHGHILPAGRQHYIVVLLSRQEIRVSSYA
jgi:hypothetical protein